MVETREERRERRKKEKAEQVAYKLEQEIAVWDPNNAEKVPGDPFKTLFVARINYYTSETKLKREFEAHGEIKSIHMVQNTKDGKPRGYAFIEYETEKEMHCKYQISIISKMNVRTIFDCKSIHDKKSIAIVVAL